MENAKNTNRGETKINQTHGYAFGEGMDCTKAATYTKSAVVCHMNANGMGASNGASTSSTTTVHSGVATGAARTNADVDIDPNLKLTHMSSSTSAFDIKVKRKRACQMKVLVVLLAMMSAACIACILAFFYMRFQHENELHFNYTRNMVMERACKRINHFREYII